MSSKTPAISAAVCSKETCSTRASSSDVAPRPSRRSGSVLRRPGRRWSPAPRPPRRRSSPTSSQELQPRRPLSAGTPARARRPPAAPTKPTSWSSTRRVVHRLVEDVDESAGDLDAGELDVLEQLRHLGRSGGVRALQGSGDVVDDVPGGLQCGRSPGSGLRVDVVERPGDVHGDEHRGGAVEVFGSREGERCRCTQLVADVTEHDRDLLDGVVQGGQHLDELHRGGVQRVLQRRTDSHEPVLRLVEQAGDLLRGEPGDLLERDGDLGDRHPRSGERVGELLSGDLVRLGEGRCHLGGRHGEAVDQEQRRLVVGQREDLVEHHARVEDGVAEREQQRHRPLPGEVEGVDDQLGDRERVDPGRG